MRFTALDGTIHGFPTDARVLDLVDFSGTYTSSCASYCEAMGMSCVGAWEEYGGPLGTPQEMQPPPPGIGEVKIIIFLIDV